jgi:hypothetical protein
MRNFLKWGARSIPRYEYILILIVMLRVLSRFVSKEKSVKWSRNDI